MKIPSQEQQTRYKETFLHLVYHYVAIAEDLTRTHTHTLSTDILRNIAQRSYRVANKISYIESNEV